MGDRKDLAMKNQRNFSVEFKRRVVEEVMSGESRPAQICRRYNISSSLLYHWKRQYSRGKFNNEPTGEAALKDRVEKLERLVGKLTLENEFLKKGLQNSVGQSQRNGKSLYGGNISSVASDGGVD
ncbi:MAG: transposase [Dehalococcoidia bacterium]|jgi:transposase-like protein|nr:transposase [Dehalococcoidia bacterium]